VESKATYVKSQSQYKKHHCHWPGCNKQVPPAMWGCSFHWFKLPVALRNRVWLTFKPGQEIAGTPTKEYIQVVKEVQDWIALNT